MTALDRLEAELARWRARGRTPSLWWRDDDAWRVTPALDRLLALAGPTPLSLAIIPNGDVAGLADRLRGLSQITISQHGLDHFNRRALSEPPGELPPGASVDRLARRIAGRRERMTRAGLRPVFYTPPWNVIDEALPAALLAAGYGALSGWGGLGGDHQGLDRLDAHVELLTWNPRPRFAGAARISEALRRELALRRTRDAFDAPIGFLTHHRDHDQASWSYLEDFLRFAKARFRWRGFEAAEAPPAQPPGPPDSAPSA